MELQTKFIEGTNEQYSIREDGIVIKHYKRQRVTDFQKNIVRMIKLYNDEVLRKTNNCCDIVINNKPHRYSINSLLFEYFNFKVCNSCNEKFIPNISPVKCDSCRKVKRKHTCDNYSKNSVDNLTKNYIANTLKITIAELSDSLYEHQKNLLLFKRHVSKTHNVNIQSLK